MASRASADDAAGEGLGRDTAISGPARVDAAPARPGDRAADDIDDAENAPALRVISCTGSQRIERLARLADGDVERVLSITGLR